MSSLTNSHGTHVEVIHSNNVEEVEVILQPKGVLIPLHRLDEGLQGKIDLAEGCEGSERETSDKLNDH